MTVLDALRLARRWWLVLLLCPLIAAAAAYLASNAMTPIYQAQLTLVTEETQDTARGSYDEILALERRASTYSRLATARPVLEETISILGLQMSPSELAAKVSVSPVRDTQLITISVKDPDPELAASVANTIGQVFIDQTLAQQTAASGTSREELERSIAEVRTQIDETSATIDELQARPDVQSAAVQSDIVSLQSQLGQYQTTYSTLLESQQRMEIVESQRRAQLRVAEQAIAPASPISPRVTLNTAIGGVLGALLGSALVLLLGYLDNTVKNADGVRRLTGAAPIGEIPRLRAKDGLETLQFPLSVGAEAYRGLRTNLQFASLGREARSIVATSLRPGDGKTTTLANLAAVIAQGGQRVILVDGDLRKPRAHKLFDGVNNLRGVTNVLLANGRADLAPFLQRTAIPGLSVLTTGPMPPNPTDVLNSASMRALISRLEEHADIVLVDAPPMVVSDPLILASLVDGVLLVTIGKRTRANELTEAIQSISRAGTPLLGVVLNLADLGGDAYSYYQAYYDPSHDGERLADALEDFPATPPPRLSSLSRGAPGNDHDD